MDALYVDDRAFVGEPLDLTGELQVLAGDDGPRESVWRKANLALRALLLAGIVGLTFGGGAILVWWLTRGGVSSDATRTAHAYLLDLKDGNFAQAYQQLCTPQESLESYSAQYSKARGRGHGVASFRLDAPLTTATSNGDTSTTSGRVTFADGSAQNVTFVVEPASDGQPSCLDTQDNLAG